MPPTSSAGHPDAGQRPKVIYVMGAGRSGSTILGVTLGNCPDFFFAGELDKWLPKSGVPTHPGTERARFWEEVRGEVDGAEALFGGEARYMERSSALFSVKKWRARRRIRAPYRRIAEDLYRAIARVAGVGHVIDSSHYPLRAREVQSIPGVELYLLYLVRDPQQVVASLKRHDVPERSFGMLTTNAYLWLTHLLSMYVFLRHPRHRRLFLRHEQLLEDPAGAVRQILGRVEASSPLPDFTSLRTGLPLHGNRLVREETVGLDGGPVQGPRRSFTTTVLQLPWSLAFSRLAPAVAANDPRTRPRE